MEFCKLYKFDPDCSIKLTGIHPATADEELLHALGEYGAVTQFKRFQGSEQGIALCEYSKGCAARMLRKECRQEKLNGKWSVFAMGLGKISQASLGDSPTRKGIPTTEGIDNISPIRPSGKSTPPPLDVQTQSTPIFTAPKAVHTVVERVLRPSEISAVYDYTSFKLKCFSGLSPRPTGEVDFETWKLQVEQLLDDPEVSCKGKKRKLVESLSPPALNEVLYAGQSATAEECLAQLEKIYGSVASSDELYAQFLEIFQKPSERPSEYLRRLNNSWRKVLEKKTGVLENQEIQLMKQFIRGCWDESLIIQLQLRNYLDTANASKKSYSELLHQVRVYEEEKEVKEQRRLKQLGRPSNKSSSSCHTMESESHVSSIAKEPRKTEDRLSHLEGAIAKMMKKPVTQKQVDGPKQENVKISPSHKSGLNSQWFFCYNCGMENHSRMECTNARNAELVQEKLISRQEQRLKQQASKSSQLANVKLQGATHKTREVNEVLTEIVGEPCHSQMFIEGVPCKCLIDTGSQVTCITLGFYEKYLSHIELHPIEEALQVIGAGGQKVPYLGYVVVSVSFPKENCGTERSQTVFALICPDQNPPVTVPVIVGTNILWKFKDDCEQMAGPQFLRKLKVDNIWAQTYAVYKAKEKAQKRVTKRLVRVAEGQPVTIPPGEVRDIVGKVRKLPEEGQLEMLLEDADNKCFPGGLMLKTQLAATTSASCSRITVCLQNASSHSITLPQKCVLARGEVVEWVKPMPAIGESDNTSLSLDFGESPISADYKQYIQNRIQQEAGAAFSKHDLDVGHMKGVKHAIFLSDNMPFKERTRSVSPADFEDLRQHLYELLASGIIEESDSPYASPIVLVRKKSGALRMVVDYRRLNSITRKDAYPLPRIEETFSLLSGSKWFTVLDLKSGYYQIEMEKEDKPKTAFTTPMGNWQFRMMPQGLTNAPATFQRMMERVMKDINLTEVIAFLDDLIIFSATLEEHEARLMKVLGRLIEHGLKLSPSKCKFFQTSVKYLGHVISQEGIQPDPDKLSALMDWPRPKTVRELRAFLGFAGYYRRFVKNYSTITKPLTSLLGGRAQSRKKGKGFGKHSQELGEQWSKACQEAFEAIKALLTTAPILGFSNWRLPYILHTDASLTGLGAALYQEQEGELRVIAYASRGLSASERNYPVHKLEFLALKWAITEKFHDYLYGAKFEVTTDNNPLTYVLTSAKLDATSHRWIAALSSYDFTIKYKAGKLNGDADGLSRRPHDTEIEDNSSLKLQERISEVLARAQPETQDWEELSVTTCSALWQRHSAHVMLQTNEEDSATDTSSMIELLPCDDSAVPNEYECPELWPGTPSIPGLRSEDWKEIQRKDKFVARVIQIIEEGTKPSRGEEKQEPPEVQLLLREWNRLHIHEGVLYRRTIRKEEVINQLILPRSHRYRALQGIHDEVGHMGLERTLDLARDRFYWPRMAADVEHKCKTCERCIRKKAPVEKAAPLVNIKVYAPMELLCIDFLVLEPDDKDTRNILVVTDYFTGYAQAYPTKDQTAKTVATTLWENFFCHYGFPERIHSDQGANFESELISELCNIVGVKSRTTPYHPRGNPVERFNRTLISMLGTLEDFEKVKWRKYVKPLVHAYNCTRNDRTGESPYFLMFGRQPLLPIDLCFGIRLQGKPTVTHQQYVKDLKRRLKHAYELARKESEKNQNANKRRWDAKIKISHISEGDRVLVRNLSLRGKHKLADRWEKQVYVVIRQLQDLPVYVLKPEDDNGPERTLHRDLLRPCGFISATDEEEAQQAVQSDQELQDVNRLPTTGNPVPELKSSVELNPDASEFKPNESSPSCVQDIWQSTTESTYLLDSHDSSPEMQESDLVDVSIESPTLEVAGRQTEISDLETSAQETVAEGMSWRPQRQRRIPAKFRDYVHNLSHRIILQGFAPTIPHHT